MTLSARIQQQRESNYIQLERCQKGSLDITEWLHWFLVQLSAAAQQNGRVVNAVRAKALFWWSHRHTSFNPRHRLARSARMVDLQALEPIGAGRSSAYQMREPNNILANQESSSGNRTAVLQWHPSRRSIH